MTSKEKLTAAIMKFTKKTFECYRDTNFAEDRTPFQSDLAICAEWFILLYDDVDIEVVISKILDTSTSKHMVDYYKQGRFGDEQASAFVQLQHEAKDL